MVNKENDFKRWEAKEEVKMEIDEILRKDAEKMSSLQRREILKHPEDWKERYIKHVKDVEREENRKILELSRKIG